METLKNIWSVLSVPVTLGLGWKILVYFREGRKNKRVETSQVEVARLQIEREREQSREQAKIEREEWLSHQQTEFSQAMLAELNRLRTLTAGIEERYSVQRDTIETLSLKIFEMERENADLKRDCADLIRENNRLTLILGSRQ